MSTFQLRMFTARRAFVAAPARSFQTTQFLAAGKESALHNEDRANEAEHFKNEQLRKQKEGKGEWHEEIASDSESIIKADRGDIHASDKTIEQLQKETEKLAEQKHIEKEKRSS